MEEQLNWYDAKDACTARGVRLAQPDTQEKNQFLLEQLKALKGFTGKGVWFGASRNPQNINQWLYTDGSELAFTSWKKGISTTAIYKRYIVLGSCAFYSSPVILIIAPVIDPILLSQVYYQVGESPNLRF